MDGKQLRELIVAAPFQPFRIHLPNGSTLDVEHADNASISPSGRIFMLLTDDRAIRVDTALIVRVDVVNAA